MFTPGSGKDCGSKGQGKTEGSRHKWKWVTFRFRLVHLALEGNKGNRHKGLWQVRKVLEVCREWVLEVVSMVRLSGFVGPSVIPQVPMMPMSSSDPSSRFQNPQTFVDFAGFGWQSAFLVWRCIQQWFYVNGWFCSRIWSHYVALMRFLQVSRVFAWYG